MQKGKLLEESDVYKRQVYLVQRWTPDNEIPTYYFPFHSRFSTMLKYISKERIRLSLFLLYLSVTFPFSLPLPPSLRQTLLPTLRPIVDYSVFYIKNIILIVEIIYIHKIVIILCESFQTPNILLRVRLLQSSEKLPF